jgi:hypothetical protein
VEFIPQKNGEQPVCAKPVAFRKRQMEIIQVYRNRGGLSQFLLDAANGQLSEAVRRQYVETLRCIGTTIKEGPVVYASGNMFRYDKTRRAVVVDAGAWREFCQLGFWIEPAVVLRWAEETNRMSKLRVSVAEALNRLVVNPTDERNVGAAKEVFDGMVEKRCVWSDKPLRGGYAVDHVIPFALWHSNDLWNLLPCDARVNGSKSDKLPERGLLLQWKDPIIFYWEKVREQHERRFDHELVNLTGATIGNWQSAAFGRLVEAVEVTAVQRGAERWRPKAAEYGIAYVGALQLWQQYEKEPATALANYRQALALGGSRALPELFAAAGTKFDLSASMVRTLMAAVEKGLERLR